MVTEKKKKEDEKESVGIFRDGESGYKQGESNLSSEEKTVCSMRVFVDWLTQCGWRIPNM